MSEKGWNGLQMRAEKCAALARAMGWTTREAVPGITKIWFTPDGIYSPSGCPNPYESAEDKDALVAWLAKQERHVQQRFIFAVRDETTDVDLCYELRIMTAPREVIADAAWLAIQEKTK